MKLSLSKGFTLIELLVVIAIIGILASIVLTSLGTARQKARDARRLSDLHQIKVALEMYATSNGRYPGSTNTWYYIHDNNYNYTACDSTKSLGLYIANVCNFKDPSGNGYVYTIYANGTYKIGSAFELASNQGPGFTYFNGTTNVAVGGQYEAK